MLCTCKTKCQPLLDICDIFDLKNLINEPTCFTVNNKPSLLDVIPTNACNTEKISKTVNFSSGLSDFHNMIACQLKNEIPVNKRNGVTTEVLEISM